MQDNITIVDKEINTPGPEAIEVMSYRRRAANIMRNIRNLSHRDSAENDRESIDLPLIGS